MFIPEIHPRMSRMSDEISGDESSGDEDGWSSYSYSDTEGVSDFEDEAGGLGMQPEPPSPKGGERDALASEWSGERGREAGGAAEGPAVAPGAAQGPDWGEMRRLEDESSILYCGRVFRSCDGSREFKLVRYDSATRTWTVRQEGVEETLSWFDLLSLVCAEESSGMDETLQQHRGALGSPVKVTKASSFVNEMCDLWSSGVEAQASRRPTGAEDGAGDADAPTAVVTPPCPGDLAPGGPFHSPIQQQQTSSDKRFVDNLLSTPGSEEVTPESKPHQQQEAAQAVGGSGSGLNHRTLSSPPQILTGSPRSRRATQAGERAGGSPAVKVTKATSFVNEMYYLWSSGKEDQELEEKLAQWKLDNEADKPSTSDSPEVNGEEVSKTPKKRKKKHDSDRDDDTAGSAKSKSKASASDKPKRPATAYILFGNGEREAVTKDNPDIAHKDIMAELGKRWKKVDPKRKAALEAEAAKLKKVYDEKLAQWKLDNEAAGKQVVPGSIVRTIHTDEISTMGNREVNKELKRLGLSKEGTLEERRERLLEHRGEKVKKKQSDPSSKTPAKTKGGPGKRKRRATGSNVYDCAFSSTHTTYFKGCVWSPCGSSLLAASDDKCVRTYDLPKGIFSGGASKKSPQPLEAYEKFPVGDLIYDYAWYPKMRAADVATCCYAVTSHAKPVQLIDSARGTLRCVYKVHDSGDELISAHSLAFSLEGDTLIGGFDGLVALWSLERPGKDPLSTHSMAQHSQSGKISTMNVNTYHPTLVACGCYDGTIGIYDTRGGAWDKLDVVQGHKGGVTQVQFSKCGNFVYSGARKDSSIHCWDMRNLSVSLHTMSRPGVERTNQTIGFDITPLNTHLMTGGADGKVLVYDLKTSELVETFQASSDAVNGVSIHPYIPVVATASGEREYGGGFFSDSSTDELLGSAPAAGVSGDRNSLRLWRPSVPYETEGWREGIVKRASYGA
mmetsp:Transcript_8937/g.27066  ORF Transcript_8937/g.27066 Transcript_8937/m.27066 type:complete len:956 (-) Transcript_8937:385-3252(-)